jgi:hypothetical protein
MDRTCARTVAWKKITRTSLTAAVLGVLVAACSSAQSPEPTAQEALGTPADPQGASPDSSLRNILWYRTPQSIHVVENATPPKMQAAANAHLTYFGGPVISSIKAYTVAWGNSVLDQAEMNSFFTAITNSTYLDWLSEYNTPTQTIGRGSFGGAFVDTNPPTGTTIHDSQIQAELSRLMDAGTIPKPDGNSYYQVLFPPGITVVGADGTQFCVQTPSGTPCAYHSTFVKNGVDVYYSPQPDYSGTCGQLCGFVPGNSTASLTTASSHEMVEAITDPAVGLATTFAAPLGWYDQNNGEIGDICEVEAQGQQVAGFFVQTEWSNKQGKCVISGPATCTPNCSGKQCGSDGCSGTCGTCPSNESCSASGTCVACTPQCSGKQCGADGCGGSCGTCTTGQSCNSSGQCVTNTSTCSHSECTTGRRLVSTCDACVKKICAADSFCCRRTWDSICVSEVGSICGETCP